MSFKTSVYALCLSSFLLLQIAPLYASSLSIDIITPFPGDISHDTNVTVQGTSWGTDLWSNQTNITNATGECSCAGFVTGPTPGVTLQRGLYDDFEDGSINKTIWSSSSSALNVSEVDGALRINGTATTSDHTSNGVLKTKQLGYTDVSADLKIQNSSGDFRAYIMLFQDSSDWLFFGIGYSKNTSAAYWNYEYHSGSGGGWGGSMGTISSGFHNIRIVYDNSSVHAYFFADGISISGAYLTLSNMEARIGASAGAPNDSVDAVFDNVWTGYCIGYFVSNPIDTGITSPLIWNFSWAATITGGASAQVQLRHDDNPDMDSPTGWKNMFNPQNCSSAGAASRYLQYKVSLRAIGPNTSVLFRSVFIQIYMAVDKVEVSLNNATWVPAEGTESWTATLAVPDGNRAIFCRATDVQGSTVQSSVTIVVDTLQPQASLEINGGAFYAGEPKVTIAVGWSGPVEVTRMWISNSPVFEPDGWIPYQNVTEWNLSDGDGFKRVYCMVCDRYGLASSRIYANITLDTVPPGCNLTIDDGARMTVKGQVNLAISASDAFGVADMQLSNEAGLDGAEWIPFLSETSWALTAGPGIKTVYLNVRDNAGHLSPAVSKTIVRITEGGTGPLPSANMTVNDGSGFATQRAVTINISTDNGAAQWMMLCNDCEFQGRTWDAFKNSISWVIPDGDGKKTVHGRFATGEGRIFCSTAEVVLDTMPPEGFFTINGGEPDALSHSVRLDFNGTDDNGVSMMMISDSPDFSGARWEPYSTSKNWTLPGGDGKKSVYVLFRDSSGLVSQPATAAIFLDTDRPVPKGSVAINGGRPCASSATVSLSMGVDDTFEARSVMMMISNEANFSGAIWEKFRSTKDWILSPGDGNKTVYVKFEVDRMQSETVSGSIVLDTVAPALPVIDPYDHSTEKSSVRLRGTAEPLALLNIAGNAIAVGPDGRFSTVIHLEKGQNDIKITITDAAGNSNSDEITIERIEFRSGQPWQFSILAAVAIAIVVVITLAMIGWRYRAKNKPPGLETDENGKLQ